MNNGRAKEGDVMMNVMQIVAYGMAMMVGVVFRGVMGHLLPFLTRL